MLIEPTTSAMTVDEESEGEADSIPLPDCESICQVISVSTVPGSDEKLDSDEDLDEDKGDADYIPDNGSSSSTSNSLGEGYVQQNKYIVFDECLKSLAYQIKCSKCSGPVEDIASSSKGTMVKLDLTCMEGHLFHSWRSQPIIKEVHVGNIIGSIAVLFSGGT